MAKIDNQHNTMMKNIEKYKRTLFMHTSLAHRQPKKRYQKSEDQKRVQQQQQQAGGLYFVARDFASFKAWFDDNNA